MGSFPFSEKFSDFKTGLVNDDDDDDELFLWYG